jgi:c-di-GMP-binding flagellar brake protein YcgR
MHDVTGITAPNHLNLIVAQRAQAIIDVAIIGRVEHFQSAILGVDRAAQTISIDELFPAGFVALPGQQVIITLRLDNDRRESFVSEVIGADRSRGGYLLQLPASVDYHQRRAAYRVPVPAHWARNSEFFTPGSCRCAGNVRDISPHGIRLEVTEWSPLQQGDTLEELHFELLGQQYQCRASVRNIRVKGSTSIEIGAAFIDLPRPQQRSLERSLMQLQRRQAATIAQSRAGKSSISRTAVAR